MPLIIQRIPYFQKLKKIGLAKGGSLENAIVLKGNEILNNEKLRNPNEFVNHKILDCLGDIYLSGYRMVGKITSSQGGHNVTNQGLRELFSNSSYKKLYPIFEGALSEQAKLILKMVKKSRSNPLFFKENIISEKTN